MTLKEKSSPHLESYAIQIATSSLGIAGNVILLHGIGDEWDRVMSGIVKILMQRDGVSMDVAKRMLRDARMAVREGADPEEILQDEFGLEPDYVFELI